MYCRRSAVDDDRSRKTRLAFDDVRRQERWAVDDVRSRIAFYQAQSKESLDRVDRNLDLIRENLRAIRKMRKTSATIPRYSSSSSFSSSASRRRRQPRHDYPPLELPLRWRDPPPKYPPLDRPMRWPDSSPDPAVRNHPRSVFSDSYPFQHHLPPADMNLYTPPASSTPIPPSDLPTNDHSVAEKRHCYRDIAPDIEFDYQTKPAHASLPLVPPDLPLSSRDPSSAKQYRSASDSSTRRFAGRLLERATATSPPWPGRAILEAEWAGQTRCGQMESLPSDAMQGSDSQAAEDNSNLNTQYSDTVETEASSDVHVISAQVSICLTQPLDLGEATAMTETSHKEDNERRRSFETNRTRMTTFICSRRKQMNEFCDMLRSRAISFETDSVIDLRSLSLSRSRSGDLGSGLHKFNAAEERLDLRQSTGSNGNLGWSSTASYRSVSSILVIDFPDNTTQGLCSIADRIIIACYSRECFQDWVALRNKPLQNLICRLQMCRQQGERTSGIINVDPELSETHNSSSFTGVQKSLEEIHNRENFEKQVCLSGSAPLHDAISGSHIPVNHEQAMLPVGDTILPIEEAMSVLKAKASQLGKPLQVALPSDRGLMNDQKLELDDEHQYMNASLAVAMSHTWLQKIGLQLISAKSSNIHCLVSILPADILHLNVKKICALYELHHVPRRIVIFRTTMIYGYTQTGITNRALQLFEEMLQDWTEVTIVSVFPICAHFAALDPEKWSLNYTRTLGFDLPPMALIARLVQTHHCFDCLSEKDKSMFLWNALIIASTSHGIGLEVISVFNDIVRNGVQANPISFSVLMYRCSHSGLVEEIKKSLKYLVDAEFLIKFMAVEANGDIGNKFSTAFKVYDPGGLVINSTSISLSTTRLDGVELF